jgi:NADPH2:quinone reductase
MRAIVIEEWGGSDVLKLREDWPEPEVGEGELLIDVTAAGINFGDTHARKDKYVASFELPFVPGSEVAGTVGARRVVALLLYRGGGYAERVAVPQDLVFTIPDGVSDGQALAVVLQGLNTWHLYRTAGRVAPGESVVIHGAAGGVGSLAVQLGAYMGAGRVIATASTPEKRELALSLGAHAAVDPAEEDLCGALIEANEGKEVDVVLEMAGGRVFDESLKALAPMGRMVVHGIASHEQNTVRTGSLMRHSRSVVGFWMMHLFDRPQEWVAEPIQELFGLVADGTIRPVVGETYPMSEVRRAHDDIESRRTTGKLLLDPSR